MHKLSNVIGLARELELGDATVVGAVTAGERIGDVGNGTAREGAVAVRKVDDAIAKRRSEEAGEDKNGDEEQVNERSHLENGGKSMELWELK